MVKLVSDRVVQAGNSVGLIERPLLTDYEGDKSRRERLIFVAGILRGRLPDEIYRRIYRLHDHKGDLSVGVDTARACLDGDRLEREVAFAWDEVNEPNTEVFYTPFW